VHHEPLGCQTRGRRVESLKVRYGANSPLYARRLVCSLCDVWRGRSNFVKFVTSQPGDGIWPCGDSVLRGCDIYADPGNSPFVRPTQPLTENDGASHDKWSALATEAR
jgi:hypothetical protein